MPGVLVIAEHDGTALSGATRSTVAAALQLGAERVDVAVLDRNPAPVAAAAAALHGVDRVLALAHDGNSPYLAAIWAPQIASLARDHAWVLAPATTFGKDLLPRVAALLGTGMLSDITAVAGAYEFLRPIYAGNAIQRVRANPSQRVCATIRITAFEPVADGGAATIEAVAPDADLPAHTRFVETRGGRQTGPDLQSARRVVGGGRGLGGQAGFELAGRLATQLGAAVGASRAAVDAGWVPNDLQVGQTGKIIAPELYVALGISGAIQHLTGIKDAGTIVAINQDAAAPICAVADIVLVADLFEAVPQLIDALAGRTGD